VASLCRRSRRFFGCVDGATPGLTILSRQNCRGGVLQVLVLLCVAAFVEVPCILHLDNCLVQADEFVSLPVEVFVYFVAEGAQLAEQVQDGLGQRGDSLSDVVEGILAHVKGVEIGLHFILLLVHVDHEELVLLVLSINVVFLLPDDAGSEVDVASECPVLEALEEGGVELWEDVLQHESLCQGKGLDVFDSKEAKFCLCIEQYIVVTKEVFGHQILS